MIHSILPILSLFLAGIAVGGSFVPRFPAALAAYAALSLAGFARAPYVTQNVLIFWGVATAIVLAMRIFQPKALTDTPHGHAYVAGATIAGTLVGFAITPSAATLILGAAIGAFLGTLAYMRTPAGPKFAIASSPFVQYLCAKGLPDVITCVMAAIVIASTLC